MPEPLPAYPEEDEVWRWRYKTARDVGLSRAAARKLADAQVPASSIRALANRGCPPEQIVRVLA